MPSDTEMSPPSKDRGRRLDRSGSKDAKARKVEKSTNQEDDDGTGSMMLSLQVRRQFGDLRGNVTVTKDGTVERVLETNVWQTKPGKCGELEFWFPVGTSEVVKVELSARRHHELDDEKPDPKQDSPTDDMAPEKIDEIDYLSCSMAKKVASLESRMNSLEDIVRSIQESKEKLEERCEKCARYAVPADTADRGSIRDNEEPQSCNDDDTPADDAGNELGNGSGSKAPGTGPGDNHDSGRNEEDVERASPNDQEESEDTESVSSDNSVDSYMESLWIPTIRHWEILQERSMSADGSVDAIQAWFRRATMSPEDDSDPNAFLGPILANTAAVEALHDVRKDDLIVPSFSLWERLSGKGQEADAIALFRDWLKSAETDDVPPSLVAEEFAGSGRVVGGSSAADVNEVLTSPERRREEMRIAAEGRIGKKKKSPKQKPDNPRRNKTLPKLSSESKALPQGSETMSSRAVSKGTAARTSPNNEKSGDESKSDDGDHEEDDERPEDSDTQPDENEARKRREDEGKGPAMD